jgi:hypothetical protein
VWIDVGALTEGGKTLGVRSSYSGDPDMIKSCLTCSTQSVWLRNGRSLACYWQTHLTNAMADNTCSVKTGQNRITWKTPSRAAFVPLQEPVAVLAILRSPHANAGLKQYECGRTQTLFRAGHVHGKTSG